MADILVRFTAAGWHRWPDAPPRRDYLASRHRHLFHVEVRVPVEHDEREVEFHDLLEFAQHCFGSGEFGDQSCETLARRLAGHVVEAFKRPARVAVLEDGEAGAEVTREP